MLFSLQYWATHSVKHVNTGCVNCIHNASVRFKVDHPVSALQAVSNKVWYLWAQEGILTAHFGFCSVLIVLL